MKPVDIFGIDLGIYKFGSNNKKFNQEAQSFWHS